MADITDNIDLTSDLGNGADPFGGQPYHGGDLAQNAIPSVEPAPVEAPDSNAPEPTLRDTLSRAFKDTQTPQLDPADRQEGEQAPLSPVGEAPPAELIKVGDRWHNKDGTFASQAQIEAFNAAQVAPQGQQPGEQPPAQQLPPYTQMLTEVERQQYQQLTPEVRAFLDRSMDQVAQAATRYSEYGQLEQLIGPRREAWQSEGMNPYAALNSLFQLSDFAGRDPGEFVLWFADQHGLDLDVLMDARDAELEAGGGIQDPRLNTLVETVNQLQNTINGFTTQASEQTVNANMQVIQQFMAEKNQDGSLKYPHFSEVSNNIGQHVSAIKASQPHLSSYDVLKAAYDFACFNNPVVRGKIQQAEQAALAAKRTQEAERARLAGSSISGGPAGGDSGNATNPSRSVRDELRYQLERNVAG